MRVTDSERAFLHELHMIRKDPLGKRLIHFFVSLAPHTPDMEKRLEWANQFIKKNFSNSPYCEVFQASNNDIFVAYSHVTVSTVLAACARIEKVFMSDGVVSQRNAYNEYAFYKVCDAVKELDKVFTAFKTLIALNQPSTEKFTKKPIAPAALVMLSEKLRTSDLRNCIFNQPVYFIGDKVPSIEYLEFYISSQMIEQTFVPDNSVTANPWLFNALKEHLDRAIFKVVAREIPEYRHKSFAINVSLPMVMSREFADFCSAMPTRLAGRIIVEVDKTDVVQNLGLYKQVVALAAEKEFKICIEGIEWGDFDVVNFSRVKADFIKVIWHNDMLNADQSTMGAFVKAVRSHEFSEVILSRCDNPRAFPLGKALGIRYIQGKLADQFFKSRMDI